MSMDQELQQSLQRINNRFKRILTKLTKLENLNGKPPAIDVQPKSSDIIRGQTTV